MSSSLFVSDLQEQICYVHCGYCTTILLVSVPCSSLTEVVTVRCGHCNCLLAVNMTELASFLPLQLFNPPFKQADQEHKIESFCSSETAVIPSPAVSFSSSDHVEDEDEEETQVVINKPPVKRERPPSAYNLFIGEEIQRLKNMHPAITHKQAFSMAAKNWAHFPLTEQRRHDLHD